MQKAIFKFKFHFDFKKSQTYVNQVARVYYSYLTIYTKSIEFNHVLDTPPDFHIEQLLLNLHLWLLLDRLNDFEEIAFVKSFMGQLESFFEAHYDDVLTKIHMGRKNDFILDTKYFLKNMRTLLNYHFRLNLHTSVNPIKKIDSLVWSCVFLEKNNRYDNKVYLIASYLLQARKAVRQITLEDIKEFRFAFNPFVVPVDYRTEIEKVNPPLTAEEMEQEMKEPVLTKRRFRYDYKEENNLIPKLEEVKLKE